MSDDPRTALRDLLSEPDTGMDEAQTALRVLQHVLEWSTSALGRHLRTAADRTRTDTLELVIALDDALSQVDGLLELVPALAEAGVAGGPVTRYLAQQSSALTEFAERVATARREHEELAEIETRLRADEAEHERLSARLADLHRMRELSDGLHELRAQEQELANRLARMLTPVADAEQALLDTANQVVTLSAERLALLGEHTRTVLETLRRSEAEWADETRAHAKAERELCDQRAEFDKLRVARDVRLAQISAHTAINRTVVERLAVTGATALEAAGGMLAEIQAGLDRLDGALAEAMTRHDELLAQEREVLSWDE